MTLELVTNLSKDENDLLAFGLDELVKKRFFFLLTFIDVFSREIKGWYLGYHCKAQDLARTLKIALEKESIIEADNLIVRSDNGPQMRADHFKN
ncbi:MAG: DDE-type integrase/transposase/recombinase [Bdellovibrionota bacterium]|nr:DDE-type integrase/transposase/recombinase [Bdellovibrionota bacterium]